MNKDVHVRVATPEDIGGCAELFIAASAENGMADLSPERLWSVLWPALHQEGGIVGVIGPVGQRLEGAVLLRIEDMWYSSSQVIVEKMVFVHPDFRSAKGGRAKKLCEFSKKVSDELDLPLIIGVLSNERTQGKVRLFERVFGRAAGAYFIHNSKMGIHDERRAGDS